MSEVKALPAPKPQDNGDDFFGGGASDDGLDFFSIDDQSREKQFNEFVGHMSQQREPMELPTDDYVDPLDTDPHADLSEEELENLQYFDYTEDHRNTALFAIGAFDSGFSVLASLMTDQDPERYQAFAKKPPPDYFVNATAALVKKYQATLSPEGMVLTGIMMIYGPMGKRAYQDRVALVKAKKAAKGNA